MTATTRPIRTPSTRTSEPAWMPTVFSKWATSRRPDGGIRHNHADRDGERHHDGDGHPATPAHQRPPTVGWKGCTNPATYESNHRPLPTTLANALTNGAIAC